MCSRGVRSQEVERGGYIYRGVPWKDRWSLCLPKALMGGRRTPSTSPQPPATAASLEGRLSFIVYQVSLLANKSAATLASRLMRRTSLSTLT
jgi:hypothetical protein